MASLDSVSIAIFLGAVLVMAGILSSLLALRFGAPLLLVFLLIGMLAGDAGPGQLNFDDVRTTYLVGSVALALILFDGGLRTKFQSIRRAGAIDGAGDGRCAGHRAGGRAGRQIRARSELDRGAAGRRRGGIDRCRGGVPARSHAGPAPAPRVGATLEAESGTNDPFAIFSP